MNHFAVTLKEGGGTRHLELSRELVSQGWEVTIAASDFNFQTRTYTRRQDTRARGVCVEHVEGVQFEWLWTAPYIKNDWRRGWNWLTFARSLLEAHRDAAPFDVVIGSSPHLLAALAAFRVARKHQLPYVLELRDLWPESMIAAGARKGLLYHALALIAAYLYKRADRIIVLARGSAAYLSARGVDPKKIVVIPNGVSIQAPAVATQRGESRAGLKIIYAGAHGAANGLGVVLEAAELMRDVDGIRFLLIGDGPAKAELVAAATERKLTNIEFRDPVPKSSIASILQAADAGLMILRDSPLFSFGVSPNKLLDYLASSVPVINNVKGEVADVLAHARAGVQTRDASGAALADSVRQLMALSLSERQELGRAGREWVERERSPALLGVLLNNLLRGLQPS